jgi:hypothetical protein
MLLVWLDNISATMACVARIGASCYSNLEAGHKYPPLQDVVRRGLTCIILANRIGSAI